MARTKARVRGKGEGKLDRAQTRKGEGGRDGGERRGREKTSFTARVRITA
jgi:hypothetical protein